MTKRADSKTIEIRSSHVAYISHPAEVAKLIEQAATQSAKSKYRFSATPAQSPDVACLSKSRRGPHSPSGACPIARHRRIWPIRGRWAGAAENCTNPI
jgi:hypothetical protein